MLSVILVSVIAGVLIGYVRGLPDDFVTGEAESDRPSYDYGYRCGDGSEFTIVPSEDMTTLRIIPATSVDYLRETTLQSDTNDAGSHYSGGGITFAVKGNTIELSTASTAPTTCRSMNPPQQSLFYLGD